MPDVLLALGLLLSTATQLRFGGSPIGPGEICILLWLAVMVASHAHRPFNPGPATYPVLTFGLVLVVSECAGLLMGMAVELFYDVPSIAHDIVAYIFLICAATAISFELNDHERRIRVVWLITTSGAAAFLLQFADARGLIDVPFVDPWHFDRLRGWSNDPNQLGFIAAILFFLGVYLTTTSKGIVQTFVALCCCLVFFAGGILTKSDSFVISVAAGAGVFLIVTCGNWLRAPRGSARAAFACTSLLAIPLVLLAAVPFTPTLIAASETYSDNLYYKDNQGDTRLMLWREALSKGLDAKFVGFGPGPHLVSKSYKVPPPYKFESHNTPLELFTQGGLIASISFLGFIGLAVLQTWRSGISSLAAMSSGLLVFSMFHFVLRHPIFWFAVILCLLAAEDALRVKRIFDVRGARFVPSLSNWTST